VKFTVQSLQAALPHSEDPVTAVLFTPGSQFERVEQVSEPDPDVARMLDAQAGSLKQIINVLRAAMDPVDSREERQAAGQADRWKF
jgi:hypothetical protein